MLSPKRLDDVHFNRSEITRNGQRCGPFLNVRYRLIRQGLQLFKLEAKGWTTGGFCHPKVFDQLSGVLAEQFKGLTSHFRALDFDPFTDCAEEPPPP